MLASKDNSTHRTESWTHDALQADLANHLAKTGDRVVWENMQLGPAGSPRPDVYTVPKSYTKFRPMAYEVKISASDYRRDVTTGKWQNYLKFASGVVFAVPVGLISKADLPPGCGLLVRGDAGWRALKGPTLGVMEDLPTSAWLKLMIDGLERQRGIIRDRAMSPWIVNAKLAKKFGQRIAELVSDVSRAEDRLAYDLEAARARHEMAMDRQNAIFESNREKQRADAIQISAERALLVEALGLDPGASTWTLINQLQRARQMLSVDGEVARLTSVISRVKNIVNDPDSW